ncbi:MAG: Polar amino acid transporter, inner rane subunit [Modestobacter sp.]|nr:Polar amino acid transporter, inner rane subunit [Modestobacter sp.]
MQFFIDNFPLLRDAFLTTLSLSLLAGLVALVLGTLLAAMRVSPVPPLRGLSTFYVETLRNTPLTVVFFFVIFGLPQIDFIVGFFPGSVIAVGLYTAAFVCEALRSGINTVSAGQAEASRALGLTFGQSLREIVLPQAFRTAIPPLGNVLIAMVKNTSIAAGFAVTELTASMQRLSNAHADQLLLVLLSVVVGYMIITVPSAWAVNRIERKVAFLR